jgi:hypothetical protein
MNADGDHMLSRFLLALILAASFTTPSFRVPAADADVEPGAVSPSDSSTDRKPMDAPSLIAMADSVESEVAIIDGRPFKHPVRKDVYSEDQLRAYLRKEIDKEYPPERAARTEAVLHMTGLLPDSVDFESTLETVLMNQVGGFYDPETEAFYMVQRNGVEFGPQVEEIMVAHELTHALDDQYVSLDSLIANHPRSQDADFALGGVVEGSATAIMSIYTTKLQLSGKLRMSDLTQLMESETERSRPFLEAPAYFQTFLAQYTCGMLFLSPGGLLGLASPEAGAQVGKRFLTAAHDLPRSSEQILHPDKYWDAADRDDPVIVDDGAASAALHSAGLEVLGEDTLGEILAAILTTPPGKYVNALTAAGASAWTNTAAEGWGGDRFFLLGSEDAKALDGGWDRRRPRAAPEAGEGAVAPPPTDTLRGLWITAWDTPEDRDEYLAAFDACTPDSTRQSIPLGEKVVAFTYGLSEAEAADLAHRLGGKSLRFTRDEKPWTP